MAKEENCSRLDQTKELLFGRKLETKFKDTDSIIDQLSGKLIDKSSVNYSELVKSLFTKSLIDNSDNFIKELPPTAFSNLENRARLFRYMNAEEICDNIPYCASALDIIAGDIVSPNHITKESIQIL